MLKDLEGKSQWIRLSCTFQRTERMRPECIYLFLWSILTGTRDQQFFYFRSLRKMLQTALLWFRFQASQHFYWPKSEGKYLLEASRSEGEPGRNMIEKFLKLHRLCWNSETKSWNRKKSSIKTFPQSLPKIWMKKKCHRSLAYI